MIAFERARAARRRRCVVALGVVVGGAVAVGPSLIDRAQASWERDVVAEARGDTAQHIAIRVGRAIRLQPELTKVSVELLAGTDRCVVAPVDVPVDCAATVKYRPVVGGYIVTAERRGERFVWDSRSVEL